MTDMSSELVYSADSAHIVRELASMLAAATQKPLPIAAPDGELIGHDYVLPDGSGGMQVERIDYPLARPTSKSGHVNLYTGESLARYVNAHRDDPFTALYADVRNLRLVAVLDGNAQQMGLGDDATNYVVDARAGFGAHRAILAVRRTPEWTHWRKLDGQLVSQDQLAEHLIDGQLEIRTPPAADMLELAQSLQATSSVEFASASRLSDGQQRLTYAETVQAKAGQRGQLDIPSEFELGVAPFEGSEPYKVTALFRFRITGGQLRVGYRLVRPDDVELHAFRDIVVAVESLTGIDSYAGAPPA